MLRRTIDLLLPALFPSWRFFQQVGPSPRIEYRLQQGDGFGPWQESHPTPARVTPFQMARRMVWNPERNTQLYMVALAERLVAGFVDHSKAELERLIAEGIAESAGCFQFRLLFLTPEQGDIVGTVVYESDPVDLGTVRP